jgi:predicted RNA methylase
MSTDIEFIWSNTDIPYACLVDKKRTDRFKEAIDATVKAGDTVIDIGSGTGIFALFAAEAGASRVYAVEVDHTLAEALRQTVEASPFAGVIEVVEGNALHADLPKNADVVIAEIIETGLMDEMQLPVMNNLHERGIIGPNTKLIPEAYQTFVDPVHVDDTFYGYEIKAPKHLWPFYKSENSVAEGWLGAEVTLLSERQKIAHVDFTKAGNSTRVDATLEFSLRASDKPLNAVRVSGIITLCPGIELGPTNLVNGDKVFSLPNDTKIYDSSIKLHVSYDMGQGLSSLKIELV